MNREKLMSVGPEQVMAVYSGKPGCACGCRGTYRYNPTMVEKASKDRGYKVDAEECNFTQVKKVLRVVKEHAVFQDNGLAVEAYGQCSTDDFFSVQVGERVYTIYLG